MKHCETCACQEELPEGSVIITIQPMDSKNPNVLRIDSLPHTKDLLKKEPKAVSAAESCAFYVMKAIQKRAQVPAPTDRDGNFKIEDKDDPNRIIRI